VAAAPVLNAATAPAVIVDLKSGLVARPTGSGKIASSRSSRRDSRRHALSSLSPLPSPPLAGKCLR
jgi:hypothetical protein